jgi:hypothetical protein
MEGGWCSSVKDILPPEPLLIKMLKSWTQGVYPTLNGRGMVWFLEGCSDLNLSSSGNQINLATRRNFTLNGRRMVWFLDGCSALNLSSSGNQSYLATRINLTLNGRGMVWFLEGCSALNLSSSGNSCTRLRSCKLFPPPVVQI